jgi:phosphatidate cytidylyltransferase
MNWVKEGIAMGEVKKRILVASVAVPMVFLILTSYAACCSLLLVAITLSYREYRTMSMIMMRMLTGTEEKQFIQQLQGHPGAFLFHLVLPLYCLTGAPADLSWDLIIGLLLQACGLMSFRIWQYKQARDPIMQTCTEEPAVLPRLRVLAFQALSYDLFFSLFVTLTLSTGMHILQLQERAQVLIAWFGATWQTDNGCLIFGKLFGQRKFAQFISPNKTWEGVLGGYLLSLCTMLLVHLLLPGVLTPTWSFVQIALATVTFSTTAVLGDLGESFVKRAAHVKDASDLIPGHGGLLDRVDSLCLGCPAAFILVKAFHIS